MMDHHVPSPPRLKVPEKIMKNRVNGGEDVGPLVDFAFGQQFLNALSDHSKTFLHLTVFAVCLWRTRVTGTISMLNANECTCCSSAGFCVQIRLLFSTAVVYTVLLLDTRTPGTSREIYIEDGF